MKVLNISFMIALAGIYTASCNYTQSNKQNKLPKSDSTISEIIDESPKWLKELNLKFKQHYPYFILSIDSLEVVRDIYSNAIFPDTTKCLSFKRNRSYLGNVEDFYMIAKEISPTNKELFLQRGNLDLWVCNLPNEIKAKDTIAITGHIYDILGNEKTWGYPTILSKVLTKRK